MTKNIVIAGGGTGGHLYPAVAIAKSLQKLDPSIQIHFVGTEQGLEKKIIPKEGFPLHFIQGGKLNFSGNPLAKIATLFKMPIAFLQSFLLILKLRPRFVLGVGGYASGPFVLVASVLRFPSAIWEPNVYPGMANRFLAKFVRTCFVVFEDSKKYFPAARVEVLGMPVREEIEKEFQSYQTRKKKDQFTLLHFGGSQGSRAIGQALCGAVEADLNPQTGLPKALQGWTKNLQITHQTGSLDFVTLSERYKKMGGPVEVKEFIYNMPDYYRQADLVVARGGASTLTELAAFGLPAIVIPLPAADGHQEHNAQTLVDGGALRMILQKDLTSERLVEEIVELRRHPERLQSLSEKIRTYFKPLASESIARRILEIIEPKFKH